MSNFMFYLLLLVSCCELSVYPMNVRRVVDWSNAIICRPKDTHVYMNHSNLLIGDTITAKTISTLGLRGCVVNIVYMKNTNRDQQVLMTHFHPDLLEAHGAELSRYIDNVPMGKYNYAHSITIYPNGRSFFKNGSQNTAKAFKQREEQFLHEELVNSRRTYKFLRSIVQAKLHVQQLDTSFVPYVLAPAVFNGIGQAAEVYVTLSNELSNPSLCQIRDAYDRKLYCDNGLNTKGPTFDRNEQQRERLILVCLDNNE